MTIDYVTGETAMKAVDPSLISHNRAGKKRWCWTYSTERKGIP